MYDVEIKDLPARTGAGLLHRGAYHAIGNTFAELGRRVQELPPGSTREAFGIFHDAPGSVPEADQTAHAGVVLADGFAVPEGFDRIDLPGGRHAVLTVRGSYDGIPGGWMHLYGTWLPASGEAPGAAPYEIYLNDMTTTPEADLVTLICMPLQATNAG